MQRRKTRRTLIPVVITVYADRSFTFITKTPPHQPIKRLGLDLGRGTNRQRWTADRAQLREIAELKMPDLNAASVEAAMRPSQVLPEAWASPSKNRLACGRMTRLDHGGKNETRKKSN